MNLQPSLSIAEILPRATFVPVTTFLLDESRFKLDPFIRPFLFRFSPIALVSFLYAESLKRSDISLFLDSGGFAGALDGARFQEYDDRIELVLGDETTIRPDDILNLAETTPQIKIVASLDCFIPPELELEEAQRRLNWGLRNVRFMIERRQRSDLQIFGSLQAWNYQSAEAGAIALREMGVNGIALGGMVPRVKRPEFWEIVQGAIAGAGELPVHVFGMGAPDVVERLFKLGVWSVDSAGYIRQSASARYWHPGDRTYVDVNQLSDPLPCVCPVCRWGVSMFHAGGLWGRSRLALHNLSPYSEMTAHT